MGKEKGVYSDKSLDQRILFFIAGFSNFLIGFALYYLFKDDKSKEWQIEFIHRGASFNLALTIIGIVICMVAGIITLITGGTI